MSTIFHADQNELPWAQYGGNDGAGNIRFKALTEGVDTATRVQFIEYAANHSDPVHQHNEGEVFVVTEGELWVNDTCNGPNSIICIPRNTDYAVRSGEEGARFASSCREVGSAQRGQPADV